MNLTRCENGHFYDAERYGSCPHCDQQTISTVVETPGDDPNMYTQPLTPTGSYDNDLKGLIDDTTMNINGEVTVGYFGDVETDPVVGWLVSVEGSNFGQDFKLKTGRNFIGRSNSMDISLTDDASISREKHAIVLYEPKSNIFLVQPGDAKELFYLNDKVVLNATELEAYDVLSIGATKLLFVPCCSSKFNWKMVKKNEDKE